MQLPLRHWAAELPAAGELGFAQSGPCRPLCAVSHADTLSLRRAADRGISLDKSIIRDAIRLQRFNAGVPPRNAEALHPNGLGRKKFKESSDTLARMFFFLSDFVFRHRELPFVVLPQEVAPATTMFCR